MNLLHLASALGSEQPFFGLQMRGVDGALTPHRTVRAMAEEFMADVRAQQGHGPYYLGGYSFGGLVALEMASLLREAGEPIGLVVLFDTMNPLNPSWTIRERLGAHVANLRERGVAYFANRLVARAQAELVRSRRKLYARLAKVRQFEYRNEAVWDAAEEAMAVYVPRVYAGDVLLLQADWRLTAGDGIGFRPHESNGWGELLPALQIVQIPTSHVDVVSEQASPLAAAALTQALASARERSANGRAPPASSPPDAAADSDGLVRVASRGLPDATGEEAASTAREVTLPNSPRRVPKNASAMITRMPE
jgi:thioesterase domain-containing protein